MPHFRKGGVDARFGRIAFGGQAHIRHGLRQVDAAFGHANHFHSLKGRLGDEQSLGIGVTDVFACQNEDTARDEFRVFAAVEHTSEPIQRRIGIAAAHRFDKRADHVVMHVFILVVRQRAMRRGKLDHVGIDGKRRIGRIARALFLGQARGQLKRGERRTSVAARQVHDSCQRFVGKGARTGQAPLLVGERTAHDAFNIDIGKRMQLNHAGTGDKRRIYFEKRVFGRSTHEHHRAILHSVQKRILLATTEAMDLVHEQNRAGTRAQQALFRRRDFAAQIGDGAADGRNFHKRRARRFSDDVGDARFARACGSVQDDGRKRIGLDCRMEPTARPHRVFLPRKLVERARTHAHGKRCSSEFLLVLYFSEQRVQLPPIYRFNTP